MTTLSNNNMHQYGSASLQKYHPVILLIGLIFVLKFKVCSFSFYFSILFFKAIFITCKLRLWLQVLCCFRVLSRYAKRLAGLEFRISFREDRCDNAPFLYNQILRYCLGVLRTVSSRDIRQDRQRFPMCRCADVLGLSFPVRAH